jgi:hypothetical protein
MIANAIIALVFGVFVGTALRPDLSGVLGSGRQVIEVQAPTEPAATPAAPAPAPSGGNAPAPAAGGNAVPPPSAPLQTTPVSTTPAPTNTGPSPNAGGGGGNQGPQQLLTGTVVRANPVARSYAVATSGPLVVIHAAKQPQPGTRISVPIDSLSNGTFAEKEKRTKTGTRKQASFSGSVTFTDPVALTYTVSARGASVLVHVPPEAGAQGLPPLGAQVTATVAIKPAAPARASASVADQGETESPAAEPPATDPQPPTDPVTPAPELPVVPSLPAKVCTPPPTPFTPPRPPASLLWQKSLRIDGQGTGSQDVEGIVQAVCSDPAVLLVSADDLRESAQDLTIALSPPLDLSGVAPGEAVDATATLGEDGTYTLTGLSSDWGRKAADDPALALGDQGARLARTRRPPDAKRRRPTAVMSSVRWRGWSRLPFVIAPRP